MKRMKVGVVLLALLLAAMAMIPIVNAADEHTTDVNQSNMGVITPDFSSQDIVTAVPLSEKEMIYVVLPEDWVLKNVDVNNPDFFSVKFSLEQMKLIQTDEKTGISYIVPFPVKENQRTALIRLPQKMFELSVKSDYVLIQQSPSYLTYYSNLNDLLNYISNLQKRSLGESKKYPAVNRALTTYPFHAHRANYQPRQNYINSVTQIHGRIVPSVWTTNGQDGAIYHEREISLNNDDTVEYVVYYRHTYYADQIFLGASMYDNGQHQGYPQVMWIEDSSKHTFEYDFSIASGHYYFWYKDLSTDSIYQYDYNDSDNPSTYISYIWGSSEVYSNVPAQYTFNAITSSIKDSWVGTTSGTCVLSGQAFVFSGYTSQNPAFVQTTDLSNANYIETYHRANNNI